MEKTPDVLPKYDPNLAHADGRLGFPVKGLFLVLSALAIGYTAYYIRQNMVPTNFFYRPAVVTLNDTVKIQVEVANTDSERVKGLSGRQKLAEGEGMLFDFSDSPGTLFPIFWMKDMNFPIDIIWISGDKVIYVDRDLKPAELTMSDRDIPRFIPPKPVSLVLEVPAGYSEKNDIIVGATVKVEGL